MTTSNGFGKKVHKEKKQSESTAKRAEASKQFDEFKSKGLPEYEIYLRVQGKKQWFPVGAIAVKRSNQIHAAIFDNEEELRKGAFRLFPVLKKNQANLEYGYRLKEYKDEPIELAERPTAKIPNAVQGAIAQVGGTIGSIFKRKSS
jgi:hypothetical protein